ncbi:MAG: hypothetical protein ABIO76_00615, partial [Ginsengibacter sp.]
GNSLPVSLMTTERDFGDPALVWHVNDATATNWVHDDTRFNVKITGIRGTGIPASLYFIKQFPCMAQCHLHDIFISIKVYIHNKSMNVKTKTLNLS